jgi:hypothetical protein
MEELEKERRYWSKLHAMEFEADSSKIPRAGIAQSV